MHSLVDKLEKPINDEYQRAVSELERLGLPEHSGGLCAKDVLRAHFLIVNHFYLENPEIGLGGIGPKSIHMLLSAVDRQYVSFDGRDKWHDQYEKCATLFYGLITNHPFHDANKRTGFSLRYIFYIKWIDAPRSTRGNLKTLLLKSPISSFKNMLAIEK